MGFLTRALVPRSVRRATHPVRTVRRAATPRSVKQAGRVLHPVSNAAYSIERSLNNKPRKRTKKSFAQRWAAGPNSPVVAFEIARCYEDRFNAAGSGVVMDSATCEPDPTDPWVGIVTGRVSGRPGTESEDEAPQSYSVRLRIQPDGDWHDEGHSTVMTRSTPWAKGPSRWSVPPCSNTRRVPTERM